MMQDVECLMWNVNGLHLADFWWISGGRSPDRRNVFVFAFPGVGTGSLNEELGPHARH